MKKLLTFLIIGFTILSMCSSVFASDLNTRLDIMLQSSEIKYLENDQGYISKNIVDSDADSGKVTIDLSLSNISNITTEEKERYDNTEIFIIVSENIVNNTEKLNTYVSYIDTLATKVFEKSSNTKIGIVGIKGSISDGQLDENGYMVWGENDEGSVAGTEANAEIVVNLTENSEDIKTGLQAMNSSKTEYRTNLQAAIRLANNSYSNNVNKLLICLYDSVPSIAIGVASQVSYGGWLSEYRTAEEAITAKHQQIATKTKNEILTLKNNNVDFIILRPDDTSYDETWYDMESGEVLLEFDGSPYVQQIYGTLENPTYGKMYSLNNDTLEQVVTEHIYQDIMEDIRIDIKSAVINEYFSDDIVKNFDITFANENVDTTNLSDNNYIIWNVGDVQGNRTVKLQYTLQIKDMKNRELLNKVISTSEKTELKYVNYLGAETTVVSTSSPKVKLTEVIEELTATVSYDPTTTTAGTVTATIKTNKRVNPVDGWTLSDDRMTLTKVYSSNVSETVHLVDEDNMTKDVQIIISNIITTNTDNNEGDTTVVDKIIPEAGAQTITGIIFSILLIGILAYNKYRKNSDI